MSATYLVDFTVLENDQSLVPQSITGTTNGTGANMHDETEPAGLDASVGAISGGTNPSVTFTVQESNDNGVTDPYAAVAAVAGGPYSLTVSANSGGQLKFQRSKKWARVVASLNGAPASALVQANMVGQRRTAPANAAGYTNLPQTAGA